MFDLDYHFAKHELSKEVLYYPLDNTAGFTLLMSLVESCCVKTQQQVFLLKQKE